MGILGVAGREIRCRRLPIAGGKPTLPARLCHAGKHTGGGHLAERNPGQPEAAEERTATTGHFAAIDHAGRAGITREHAQANVILLLLEFPPEVGIFRNSLLLPIVTLFPALFRHRGWRFTLS